MVEQDNAVRRVFTGLEERLMHSQSLSDHCLVRGHPNQAVFLDAAETQLVTYSTTHDSKSTCQK